MTEEGSGRWLFEAGIGEDRAALVRSGQIVEAHIERHGGIKGGEVCEARLAKKLATGKRAIVHLPDGSDALLSTAPASLSEGQKIIVEIMREAIDEKSRFKWPLVKVTDKTPRKAATLVERIESGDYPVQHCQAHEPDHLGEAGWHELTDEARSGLVRFSGGSLQIALTPAMTLIDVDGELPPPELACVAARESARVIRRLQLQGSIAIDFPNVEDKPARQKVAEIFDAGMHGDFEKTAINGFGLMQIVTRRSRPSLPELLQRRRMTGHALELLRLAERNRETGALILVAHPAITSKLSGRPIWLEELQRRTGREVQSRADPKLAIGGGYVARA